MQYVTYQWHCWINGGIRIDWRWTSTINWEDATGRHICADQSSFSNTTTWLHSRDEEWSVTEAKKDTSLFLSRSDQKGSIAKDKLKDLMQRCKTLINTILILDDYVVIDDRIIDFIQESLPFLNSGKSSVNEEQLVNHYSDLLRSLTVIVNDLRQRLPIGMVIS